MSEDDELWPVEPSQGVADALADPRLPVDQFARIVALTVAIAQDPWLPGSRPAEQGAPCPSRLSLTRGTCTAVIAGRTASPE